MAATSFDDRELCPDGACIGVIGPDGRCKECGAQGSKKASIVGEPREPGLALAGNEAGADDERDALADSDSVDDDDHDDEHNEPDDDEDEAHHRELCSDELCVGLIGPDGFCKECGKPGSKAGLDPRTRGLRSEDEIADELEANITKGDLPEPPDSFDDRELCPDGACIGVIGADNRCSECGTRGQAPARKHSES